MTELIVTLEDNTSATIIRKAISLLKGVKSVVTKQTKELSNIQKSELQRLEELKSLRKGWDGEDAMPIYRKAINNVKSIIKGIDDQSLMNMEIFPETNGTILLQKKDNTACASIGNDSYSIYSESITINKEHFKISQVINDLKKM